MLTDFRLGRLDIRKFSFHIVALFWRPNSLFSVIATYDRVRREIDSFEDLALSCIFLDEAHKIKNMTAKITQEFAKFECKIRFGLTVRSFRSHRIAFHRPRS